MTICNVCGSPDPTCRGTINGNRWRNFCDRCAKKAMEGNRI